MKLKLYFLLLSLFLFISACKKENEPQPVIEKQPEKWIKFETNGANENFRAAHVINGFAYFASSGFLLKIDASEKVQAFVLNENQEEHFLFKPSFSDNYLVQVNNYRSSIMAYDLDNPKTNIFIPRASLGNDEISLDVVGAISDNDQLMVGFTSRNAANFRKSMAALLTFSTTGGAIQATKQQFVIDSVSAVTNHVSRINITKNNHFVTPRYSYTLNFDDKGNSTELGFRMSTLAEVNDTLYAANFWDSQNGDGLFISVDGGFGWQKIADGVRFDFYNFHKVNGKLVLTLLNKLYHLKIDYKTNKMHLQELTAEGLEGIQGYQANINAIAVLNEKVYLATSHGIYFKNVSDFFRHK